MKLAINNKIVKNSKASKKNQVEIYSNCFNYKSLFNKESKI